MDAIKQLLENDCFGCRYVVVVKDNLRDQEEMHLDTYFNIINAKLGIMLERRINAAPSSPHYTACDVYERNAALHKDLNEYPEIVQEAIGLKRKTVSFSQKRPTNPQNYSKIKENINFATYLTEQLSMKIIPVTKEDQLIYGCNFLTLSPNEILLVKRNDGVSAAYRKALQDNGVRFTECNMTSITKLYGAAHCMTQVSRLPPGSRRATAGRTMGRNFSSNVESILAAGSGDNIADAF
jgi:arginine deiminase